MSHADGEDKEEPPIWEREDPYLDENGELPVDEAHHRHNVQAAIDTVKDVGPLAIIPIGLVMLVASLIFGEWVWKLIILLPFLFYAAIIAIPLVARMRKGGELRIPGHGTLKGKEKRNALVMALGLA